MVNNIYGRANILNTLKRSNLFVNELKMYTDYLKKEIEKNTQELSMKKNKYLAGFKNNLIAGIGYYKNLTSQLTQEAGIQLENFKEELSHLELKILELTLPETVASS